MATQWRIELFGGLRVILPAREIARFRTHKTGFLLAYLALFSHQGHGREALAELFWPDLRPEDGRNNLSTALSSLRRQLETPRAASGSLIQADHQTVRLNTAALQTDIVEFEAALHAAERTETAAARRSLFERAAALYRGDLLPGCYEDWALREQARLSSRHFGALLQWAALLEADGALMEGLDVVERAIAADAFAEAPCRAKMRLLAAMGRQEAARATYRELEQRLRKELRLTPSHETQSLFERLEALPVLPPRAGTTAGFLQAGSESAPAATSGANRPAPARPPLPMQWTRFFGRDETLQRLCALLDPESEVGCPALPPGSSDGRFLVKTRLVTLTGPGGIGKTRLAVQVAERMMPRLSGRVGFVPLADITHPHLMPYAIASALGLTSAAHTDLLHEVANWANDAPALLIMDNFEHLIEDRPQPGKMDAASSGGATALVRLLLECAPGLVCLVTSRCVLHLRGEQQVWLDALPVPTGGEPLEELETRASVALYLDRARQVLPDFVLTPRNAAAVADLCRRLEGMPLALELAAGWAKTLTPARMLERLDVGWRLPESRVRDAPARHHSLRAVFAWSFALLTPELQLTFARLAVFRGGWSLEAAEAVCGADALDHLVRLQEHSLVQGGPDDEIRWRLLEPARQFAEEQLTESGLLDEARSRHARFFLALAERQNGLGESDANWFAPLEADCDNLSAAWRSCLRGADLDSGVRFGLALDWFWTVRGYAYEREQWRKLAIQRKAEVRPELRAEVLWRAADYAEKEAALGFLEECLHLYQALGDRRGVAWIYDIMAQSQDDSDEAIRLFHSALAIYAEVGAEQSAAYARACLANAYMKSGRYEMATELLAVCREFAQRNRQWTSIAKLDEARARIALRQGDLSQARALLAGSRATLAEYGDKRNLLFVLEAACHLALLAGDYVTAWSLVREMEELEKGTLRGTIRPSWMAALHLHWLCGEPKSVRAQADIVTAHFRSTQAQSAAWYSETQRDIALVEIMRGRASMHDGDVAAALRDCQSGIAALRRMQAGYEVAGALPDIALACWRAGQEAEAMEAAQECLALCRGMRLRPCLAYLLRRLGLIATEQGEIAHAARLIAASSGLCHQAGLSVPPVEQRDSALTLQRIRSALDEPDWDAMHAEEASVSLEQALSYGEKYCHKVPAAFRCSPSPRS